MGRDTQTLTTPRPPDRRGGVLGLTRGDALALSPYGILDGFETNCTSLAVLLIVGARQAMPYQGAKRDPAP